MRLFKLTNLNFKDKHVLVRTGFDMPIDSKGKITDDSRIKEALPTLNYLLKKRAKLILIFHHHRPDGKIVKKYRVDAIAKRLSQILKKKVTKLDHTIGPGVKRHVDLMKPGDILVLENLRFHAEEEKGGKGFAKALASYADYYVNEAFSNCHRDHASMTGVPTYIPSCLGFHAYDELTHLSLHNAKKPIYAIIGGVKLETRVPMLENFARFAKKILLGGAMVFTFYKALGYEVGKSLVDRDEISVAKKLMKKYSNKLILPEDILVADKIGAKAKTKNVDYSQMPKSWIGVDNGKRSLKTFAQQLKDAKTIVWNGPIGIFEEAKFANGTRTIAKILAGSRAKTIIGGGDTSTAVHHFKLARKMNHVSTAGGASLTLLEGKALPAIVALEKNYGRFYKRFKKK